MAKKTRPTTRRGRRLQALRNARNRRRRHARGGIKARRNAHNRAYYAANAERIKERRRLRYRALVLGRAA